MRRSGTIFQGIFRGLAEYGLQGSEVPNLRREHMVINLFALILTILGSIMFAANYIQEEYLISSIIAFMIIVGLISFMIHLGVHSRRFSRIFMPVMITLIALVLFKVHGFRTPMVDWLYLFPIIFIGGVGLRAGGVATLILWFFFVGCGLLNWSKGFVFDMDTFRFLLTFAGVALLVMVLEYAREEVEKEWRQITKRFPIKDHEDVLTGLPDRKEITLLLKTAMDRAQSESTSLSILFCDFDFYKGVASRVAQANSDSALVLISRLLKDMITGNDIIARWANEEFLLILTSSSEKGVEELIRHIRAKVAEPQFTTLLDVHHVDVTVGYATWDYEQDEDLFLQVADTMLYVAKQEARDTAL